MGNRRSFTPEFKAKVVIEALAGLKSAAEVCREHGLKMDLLSHLGLGAFPANRHW
jgi:transposase-like protein